MPKSRKPRQTTSVSTLVSQLDNLIVVANVAGRKDLLKVFAELYPRVAAFANEYTKLRAEIDPFVKLLTPSNVDAILATVSEDVEETEDVEA